MDILHLILLVIATSFKFQLLRYVFVHSPLPCSIFLQQQHMENVMDLLSFRQFKFIGLATHQVQNLKKLKKLRLQLLIAFGFDIFTFQPNFLAKSITSRLGSFIMGLFLQFLGILQVLSACSHKIPKFLDQLINCFGPGVGVDVFFIGNVWVISTVKLERHMPRITVFHIIISKFYHRQEP